MADRALNDVGQPLLITMIGVDVLDWPTRAINVTKPNGTTVAWTPSAVDVGLVTYIFQTGDLNQVGLYTGRVQLNRTGPTQQITSSTFVFTVA